MQKREWCKNKGVPPADSYWWEKADHTAILKVIAETTMRDWNEEETPEEIEDANECIEADERRAFLKDEFESTLSYEEQLAEMNFEVE